MPKEKPLTFKSLPGVKLTFHPATIFKGTTLQLEGKKLKKKGRKFMLPEPNKGKFIKIKTGFDIYVPTFEYENEKVTPLEQLPILLCILALFPMGLTVVGGLIGGVLGGAAWYLNLAFLHSNNPLPVRIGGALAITATTVGLWLAIAVWLVIITGSS